MHTSLASHTPLMQKRFLFFCVGGVWTSILHARYYMGMVQFGGVIFGCPLSHIGIIVLSAVRNQEASASRRLSKCYIYAECNP